MFDNAFAFNQDVSSWDMRKAEIIDVMFSRARLFNNGDLNNAQAKPLTWYLPKVKSATHVFHEQNPFNQDIGSWFAPQGGDVMQVENLYQGICARTPSSFIKEFNNGGSANINNWRIPNATNLGLVFSKCAFFNQPVGSWDVSGATNMQSMFFGNSAFNQDLTSWNTANVTNMSGMFSNATSFNNGDPGDSGAKPLTWNVANVTDFSSMFYGASAFNQEITSWNVTAASNLSQMLRDAVKFNRFVGNWSLPSATNISGIFQGATAFNNGDPIGVSTKPLSWASTGSITNLSSAFSGARSFNQSIGAIDTSSVTNMASMFASASSFDQDISDWDVSKVTSFNGMFNAAVSFRQNLSNWTPTAGTDFTNIFATNDINTPGTTDNYDNFLLKVASVTNQNTRSLGGGSARYSYAGLGSATSSTGRAFLTTATNATPNAGRGWTVSDGGSADCTFSSSSGLLVTYSGDRPTFSQVVFKTNGTLPTGLTAGTTYWTVRVSGTTARLATSLANAQAGTVISFTDAGSGTHSVMNRGHVFTASNSSGNLLLTLTTGGDLNFSGRRVRFSTTGTLPAGISAGVDYRLNRVSATTYRVTTTATDAVSGTNFITFTDSGTGTHELMLQ
jgi:surface protein